MLPDSFLSRRAITLGLSVLLLSGCRRRERKIAVQLTDEDTATLATVVYMGDPKTAPQLLMGFYNIEENTWRWTSGKFTRTLNTWLEIKFSNKSVVGYCIPRELERGEATLLYV